MAQLNRKSLLKKDVLQIEKVDLGPDEFVYVRQMTGHERDVFEQSLIKKTRDKKGQIIGFEQQTEEFRAKLAVVTVSDEAGVLLLNPDDFLVLSMNMSAKKLEKIINVAQRLNGISDEDKENLVKNSDAVQDGTSNSDSAENLESSIQTT